MAKQSSQTTITILCKPAASSTCFTLLQCSRSRAWLLMNSGQCKKLSFLRYLSWSSTSQKEKKKKKERTFEKEKSCYFGSVVPKRQVFWNPIKTLVLSLEWALIACEWMSAPWEKQTKVNSTSFHFIYVSEDKREGRRRRREQRERLKCWVGLWAKAIASCNPTYSWEDMKELRPAKEWEIKEQEKEKEKEKGCC